MSKLKIVNLGLPKSGTTTLARALQEAGLFVADHRVRRDQCPVPEVRGTFVGSQIYAGYFDNGDPFGRLGFYDALTEISALRKPLSLWPQCDYPLVKAMRDRHPDMKFVVTWRPAEAICDSMQRWGGLGQVRIPAATIPGLPHGFGAEFSERIRWIEDNHAMLRDVFAGCRNFLQLDMAAPDARGQLAEFLGMDLPWWGRANVNTDNPAKAAS